MIYTRTGDGGTTGLFGKTRVSKGDIRIEACGTIDELTSYLGLIVSKITKNKKEASLLAGIQKDLYQIMAAIAGAKVDIVYLQERVNIFERSIDFYSSKLPKLNSFILPGGGEISSFLQISRTICRRAERCAVTCKSPEPILKYLNRLSDLLFILARLFSNGKEITVKL